MWKTMIAPEMLIIVISVIHIFTTSTPGVDYLSVGTLAYKRGQLAGILASLGIALGHLIEIAIGGLIYAFVEQRLPVLNQFLFLVGVLLIFHMLSVALGVSWCNGKSLQKVFYNPTIQPEGSAFLFGLAAALKNWYAWIYFLCWTAHFIHWGQPPQTSIAFTLVLTSLSIAWFSFVALILGSQLVRSDAGLFRLLQRGQYRRGQPLPLALTTGITAILNYLEESENLRRKAAIGAIVRQVAHDIRSPLAALNMVLATMDEKNGTLTGEKRNLLRAAASRICEIANDLLSRSQTPTPEALAPLLATVVEEKRLQFQMHSGIEIKLQCDSDQQRITAMVRGAEFKRVISNLLNNAVESIEVNGKVMVTLGANTREALIDIADTGKGIMPEVLAKLGREEISQGKAGGIGLGLSHAQRFASECGGYLELSSKERQGTTVRLRIPLLPGPVAPLNGS